MKTTHCTTRVPARPSRRGNALLLCIVLIVPMLIVGLALMRQGVGQKGELAEGAERSNAQLIAEAGIAEAVASLRQGANGNIGSQAAPAALGNGLFWVEATYLPDKQIRLLSIGLAGKGRTAVDAVVQLQPATWRTYGVFSGQSADFKGKFFMDSYDSRLGSYASQVPGGSAHANSNAAIGSNSDIDIGKKSNVWGDLRPGPTGTAITGGSFVSGSTTPSSKIVSFGSVSPPALPAGAALSVNGVVTLPAGNYRFKSLSVANGSELLIPGPSTVVIDGDLDIAPHAKVQVGVSGAVEIYTGGNVAMGTGAGIETPSGSALDFTMYLTGGPGQTALFNPHGDFYGTVYGPNAEIQLGNDLNVFGAIAGDRLFCQNPNVQFHWDEALADAAGAGGGEVAVLFWMPAAFPDQDLLHDRTDPFALMGLNRGALTQPADAWDMSGFPPGF